MESIRSLRPNVSREQAVELFSRPGILGAPREAFSGPLRSISDFYIPFRVFRLGILNGHRREAHILAVDSVTGTLMPYLFREVPSGADVIEIETRNHVSPALAVESARRVAETRSQRMLFASGFFRVRELKISSELAEEVHVPYWVGFRGRGNEARFSVMDAVRRRTEGAKVRQILRNWLISEEGSDPSQLSDCRIRAACE